MDQDRDNGRNNGRNNDNAELLGSIPSPFDQGVIMVDVIENGVDNPSSEEKINDDGKLGDLQSFE